MCLNLLKMGGLPLFPNSSPFFSWPYEQSSYSPLAFIPDLPATQVLAVVDSPKDDLLPSQKDKVYSGQKREKMSDIATINVSSSLRILYLIRISYLEAHLTMMTTRGVEPKIGKLSKHIGAEEIGRSMI
jgi:hypothetical protein